MAAHRSQTPEPKTRGDGNVSVLCSRFGWSERGYWLNVNCCCLYLLIFIKIYAKQKTVIGQDMPPTTAAPNVNLFIKLGYRLKKNICQYLKTSCWVYTLFNWLFLAVLLNIIIFTFGVRDELNLQCSHERYIYIWGLNTCSSNIKSNWIEWKVLIPEPDSGSSLVSFHSIIIYCNRIVFLKNN